MGTFKFIPKEIKEQILKRIKEDGITAQQAALEHGISRRTIYNWLRSNTLTDGSILGKSQQTGKSGHVNFVILCAYGLCL